MKLIQSLTIIKYFVKVILCLQFTKHKSIFNIFVMHPDIFFRLIID